MIVVTNRLGLPDALVRAVVNDSYSRDDADFTVTELLHPPQLSRLNTASDIPEDVSDRIWALLGQAVHTILERAAGAGELAEKRRAMTVTVDGRVFKISGGFDHLQLENGRLTDWKITSVYAREGKAEWEAQLNLLALILRANNVEVSSLQNVLIFRDWRPKEALRGDGYPERQVARLSIELWPMDRTIEFLHQRIRDHVAATPRPCTPEERWAQPDKIALMKKGAKKAIKLYEGKAAPESVRLMPGQFWEPRPGAFRRCEGYCPVAGVCPQWAADRPPEKQAEPDLVELLEKSIASNQTEPSHEQPEAGAHPGD